jgi:hypothetical protein
MQANEGLAEGVGFEPTRERNPLPVFKTGALNHSAILPKANPISGLPPRLGGAHQQRNAILDSEPDPKLGDPPCLPPSPPRSTDVRKKLRLGHEARDGGEPWPNRPDQVITSSPEGKPGRRSGRSGQKEGPGPW